VDATRLSDSLVLKLRALGRFQHSTTHHIDTMDRDAFYRLMKLPFVLFFRFNHHARDLFVQFNVRGNQ